MTPKKKTTPKKRSTSKKKKTPKKKSPGLSGHLALLRMRVASAESIVKEARDQASQAKRRRKLAKMLAKRARKDAKQAEASLAKARDALARAVAALITDDNRRTAKRKTGRTKPVARSASALAKKRSVTPALARQPVPLEDTFETLDAGTAQAPVPSLELQERPASETTTETYVKSDL